MAKAVNQEAYSSRDLERAKAREGERAGSNPCSSRYKMRFPFHSRWSQG
jgi:hypothetical protein